MDIPLLNENTVESVALLQKNGWKLDMYVKLSLGREDFYRFKDEEK